MRRELVDLLACPDDRAPLDLAVGSEQDGDVMAGTLTCTRCGFAYPVEGGIPNLLPPAMHRDEVQDGAVDGTRD